MICHAASIGFLKHGAIALYARKVPLELGVRMVLWQAGVAAGVGEVGQEYAADGYRYPQQARVIDVLHVVRCMHAPRHELFQRSVCAVTHATRGRHTTVAPPQDNYRFSLELLGVPVLYPD